MSSCWPRLWTAWWLCAPQDEELEQNLCLDAGYVGEPARQEIEARGYVPHVRPRGEEIEEKDKNPEFKPRRWVVEVCRSWFNRFKKILVRYETTHRSYLGLLKLAASISYSAKSNGKIRGILFMDKFLNEYSLGIDLWDNEAGDTFLILGARELLHRSLTNLNQEQLNRLIAADKKAEKTLLDYSGADTFDVKMLKDIVEIVRYGVLSKAA